MMYTVDSSALALLVNPDADPPIDPATNAPLTEVRDRIEGFLSGLSPTDTLIIPTPVLAEALVKAGDGGPALLSAIGGMARVRTRAFDTRAAIETAIMTRDALAQGGKKAGSEQPWQKVKVDRQVIAIARVENSSAIFADDKGLVGAAKRLGMEVFSSWDLPIPEREVNLFSSLDRLKDGLDQAANALNQRDETE